MDPNQSLEVNPPGQMMESNENENDNNRYTLDEPKRESLKRELRSIIEKSKIALLPMRSSNNTKLLDWDFWGPLLLCLTLGLVLSWQKSAENSGTVFVMIFGIVWIGGLIVSLNSQFLGINLSLYQCICILGYCMLAIVLASIINLLLGFLPTIFHICVSLTGACYSTFSKFILLLFLYNIFSFY